MSAKHRKASKLAAKRTAVAATAVGATAAVGLMSAPAQAAAPDYSKAISDYSHALDNFLNASNNVNGSLNSVWGPIANGSGGILPTFGSTFTLSDATNLLELPQILRNLGGLRLPTAVPGTTPDVVLPGGGKLELPLPATIPGGDLLIKIADQLDTVLNLPLVKEIVKELPSAGSLINGLEITQSKYHGVYDWKLLGLNGETNFLNTFLKTPSGVSFDLLSIPLVSNNPVLQNTLKLLVKPLDPGSVDLTDVSILPEGTLPSGTVWVPQGDGTYNFPLGAQLGWWAAAPTAAVKLPAWLTGDKAIDTVISVPIYAAGGRLPLNLAEAGIVGANVLLPTANGVYSPVSLTMTNLNTILPFGLTNVNVTTGNYVGTNGINVNNGQNLLLLQNPLGIPLPLVYGLGGFNFGVEGAGLTSPSLFGFKLFSDNLLQVGEQTGPNTAAGVIPPNFLPTDPISKLITGIMGPLNADSLTGLLGLDAVIKPVMTAFGPVYQVVSAATLKPLSDFATSQYGPFINGSASQLLDLSKTLSEQSANLPGAPAQSAADSNASARSTTFAATGQEAVSDTTSKVTVPETGGDHSLDKGGEPLPDLLARFQGDKDKGDDGKSTPTTQTPAPESPAPDPAPSAEDPAPEPPAADPVTAPEPPAAETETATAPSTTDTATTTDDRTTGAGDAGADKAA